MTKVLTNEQNYYDIADTIRQMKNVNTTYKPRQMASALKDIYSNEVEGLPPLSFEANGNNLLNYRIDGASGGVGDRTKNLCPYNKVNNSIIAHVESGKTYSFSLFASFLIGFNLMKRNASSQSTSSVATKYNSEGNVSATFTADEDFDLFVNGFSSISGKTFLESVSNFQLEESSTVTDYEPYGYKVPVVVNGKNLLKNTENSFTLHGVTFTVNNDKSITCNGTASSMLLIVFSNYFEDLIVNNEYIFSGCPPTGSISTYRLQLVLYSGAVYNIFGEEKKFTYKEEYVGNPNKSIRIVIEKDCVCNNLTFYPMMRLASIEDDTYEPYIEPTTTNIYLDEPILENESISLSDTNTNIPTIDGTNVITIDTTIQPSNVYIQAPKDSDEIIEIINTLEAI